MIFDERLTVYLYPLSSVEQQLTDMKQRLRHVEHLAHEHRAEYKRFDESLHLFRTHVDGFHPTIQERLRDATIDTIRTMDVSSQDANDCLDTVDSPYAHCCP